MLTQHLPTDTLPGASLFIRNGSSIRPSGCWFFQFGCTKPTSFSDHQASHSSSPVLSCEPRGPAGLSPALGTLRTQPHPQMWPALGPGVRGLGPLLKACFLFVIRVLVPRSLPEGVRAKLGRQVGAPGDSRNLTRVEAGAGRHPPPPWKPGSTAPAPRTHCGGSGFRLWRCLEGEM